MGTYWDEFIEKYGKTVQTMSDTGSLVVVLEAFYFYCHRDKEQSKEIIDKWIAFNLR